MLHCRSQESDFVFFKKHPPQELSMRFQPCRRFTNSLSRDLTGCRYNALKRSDSWLRQPGDSHDGLHILHKGMPREANVESGLSLQTRRAFLQQVIPQYRKATTVKKKSKLLDAATRNDRLQSQVRHVAPQPCTCGAAY